MKTIYTTIALLFFSIGLQSQNYVAIHTKVVDNNSFDDLKPRVFLKTKSINTLTLEIYNDQSFDYDQFLKDSENSITRYRAGNIIYTKRELIKIFRKGARKSENVLEFEKYLDGINSKIVPAISERESDAIFHKFREGRLHAYLDNLSSSGIVLF